jgi:hypothetical protein
MSDHRHGPVVRYGCRIDPYLLGTTGGNILLAEQCSCELNESAFDKVLAVVERIAAEGPRGSPPSVYFVRWSATGISCHRFGCIQ